MDHRRSFAATAAVTTFHRTSLARSPSQTARKITTPNNNNNNNNNKRMVFGDERYRNGRRQRLLWMGLTCLAVIAIVVVNSDRSMAVIDKLEEASSNGNTNNNNVGMDEGPVGRMSPMQPKPIEWISVLGERNSGTRWLYE